VLDAGAPAADSGRGRNRGSAPHEGVEYFAAT
jgi:hypothetical protein